MPIHTPRLPVTRCRVSDGDYTSKCVKKPSLKRLKKVVKLYITFKLRPE